MRKKIALGVTVSLIVALIISVLSNNVWTTHFSIRTANSYFQWIIIESILVSIFFYGLIYLWDIAKLLRIRKHRDEALFRVSFFKRAKRIVFYLFPIIFGLSYFMIYNDFIYRFGRFSEKEIGILVANFREVALIDYIPQVTYSNFLKEELPIIDLKCLKNAPIKFKSTNAFFTSMEEANNYGAKAGARLVVWGEVSKTKGVIRIYPKVSYPFDVGWSLAGKEFPDIYMYESFSEDWELSGAPPDIEKISCLLAEFLVLPAVITLKSGLYETRSFINYCRCTLERESLLPYQILGTVAFDLARVYFENETFDSSLYFMRSALHKFEISDIREQDRQFLVTYIEDKIKMLENKLL